MIGSQTVVPSMMDFTMADAIVRAKNNCYIREDVQFSLSGDGKTFKVLRAFYIQLSPTEDGFIASSGLSDIYELEATMGDAVRSYLYSLADELNWLERYKENLSNAFLEELKQIKQHLQTL